MMNARKRGENAMKIELDEMLQGCKAFRSLHAFPFAGITKWIIYYRDMRMKKTVIQKTAAADSPTLALRRMAELTGDEKLLAMLTSH